MLAVSRHRTKLVRPPRALYVPFPLGQTAGRPGDIRGQTEVARRALDLLTKDAGGAEETVEETFRQDS